MTMTSLVWKVQYYINTILSSERNLTLVKKNKEQALETLDKLEL